MQQLQAFEKFKTRLEGPLGDELAAELVHPDAPDSGPNTLRYRVYYVYTCNLAHGNFQVEWRNHSGLESYRMFVDPVSRIRSRLTESTDAVHGTPTMIGSRGNRDDRQSSFQRRGWLNRATIRGQPWHDRQQVARIAVSYGECRHTNLDNKRSALRPSDPNMG